MAIVKVAHLVKKGGVVEVDYEKVVIHGLLHSDEIRIRDISDVQLLAAQAGGGIGKLLIMPCEGRGAPREIPFDVEHEHDAETIKHEIDNQLMLVKIENACDADTGTPGSNEGTLFADGAAGTGGTRVSEELGVGAGADNLEKWAELRDKGLLTPEEFEFKKKELLYSIRGQDGKEIVKVPCSYCGTLVDVSEGKCPSCGAPIQR